MITIGTAEKLSHMDEKIRSTLAEVLPPSVFTGIYSAARTPILKVLAKEQVETEAPSHPVEFAGIKFRNDAGNAAGFDKDGSLLAFNYKMGAGFGLVGTVLNEPHTGNYLNKIARVNPWVPLPHSDAAINSIGLRSKGAQEVIRNIGEFRDFYQPIDFPVIGSVMGHPKPPGKNEEERAKNKFDGTLYTIVSLFPHVDVMQINESCPNVSHGNDGDTLQHRLEQIVMARDVYQSQTGRKIPLVVKMRDYGNAEHTVAFMTDIGIDGLAGLNTQIDYEHLRQSIDEKDLKVFDYYTKKHNGGVSGAPIKDRAYDQTKTVVNEIRAQKSPLKVMHVGGLRTHDDMEQSRALGEAVVLREWYTGLLDAMAKQPFDQVYSQLVNGK